MYNISISSVTFIINGDNINKLLSNASKRNIVLLNVKKSDYETYIVTTLPKYKKQFINECDKLCINYKVSNRKGIEKIRNFYKLKETFILLFFISFLLFFLSRTLVLDIEINGNMMLDDEQIIEFLKEDHVKLLDFKKNVNFDLIEKAIPAEFKQISWANVEIKSNGIIINIVERDSNFFKDNSKVYYKGPLISDSYGIVRSIFVKSGTPAVEIGDVISPGDILINDYVIVNEGLASEYTNPVDAKGIITIEVEYNSNKKMKILSEEVVKTGNNYKIFKIKLAGKIFKIGSENIPFNMYVVNNKKEIDNNKQVDYSIEIYDEIDVSNTYINEQHSIQSGLLDLKTSILNKLPENVVIVDEDYSYQTTATTITLMISLKVLQDISK